MRDNGLTAATYVSMGGIDPFVAEPVLAALAEAGIAAYAAAPGDNQSPETERTGERAAEPSAESAAPDASTPGATAPEAVATEAAGVEATSAEGLATEAPTAEAAPTDSGATDAAAVEAASTETPVAAEPAGKPAGASVRPGREEIFVDAGSAERARAVILRSTEDAEWKALVEQFNAPPAPGRGESPVPRWPASEDVDSTAYEPLIDVPSGLDQTPDTEAEEAEAEEAEAAKRRAARANDPHDHFVPPEPPRGPRLDWISRAAWLGLIGGPLLLVMAALFDFGESRITQLAVVGFVGGFLTLVFRMKDRLPGDDSGDDGAVV